MTENNKEKIISMRNISKYFPGVTALDDVNFDVHKGEVVILVGENGAGKSTLMKIIAGVYKNDAGKIILEGDEISLMNPAHAKSVGISIVYQEQALIPDLNAIENIFIGREISGKGGDGMFIPLDKKYMKTRAEQLIRETFEMNIDLSRPVKHLPLVERQIIEIVRAIVQNCKILILDEPTAALEDYEREHLFTFIKQIRALGVGIVYCSHYLEECLEIGDRIVAIRDGKFAGEMKKEDASVNKVIELMIGKSIDEQYPKTETLIGADPLLRINNLSMEKEFCDVTFDLFSGEILGIGGLAGSGKTALARSLFGIALPNKGDVSIQEISLTAKNIEHRIENGIAFLPSDRKSEGLFINQSIKFNISISNLKSFGDNWLNPGKEKKSVEGYIKKLNIKTPTNETIVSRLSGGNQQKSMIARWLSTEPKVIIFEEPTRGIDVNAKVEVYRLIGDFVSNGGAVILISSEVQELEGICDRVIVINNGRVSCELKGDQLTKKAISYYSVTTDDMERE